MKTINIPLPKIGESTTEAKIVEWLKKPGDFIKRDELFAVIGTDKVDSEIFSEYEGTLKEILVKEGEEVSVGTPICTMEVDDAVEENSGVILIEAKRNEESLKDFSTPLHSAQNDKTQLTPRNSELVSFLSPVVRKMAAENGLSLEDLQKINGTGENGRIRKQDVENFLKPRKQNTSTPFIEEKLQLKVELGETLEPLSKIRKLIAENMEKSWRSIPHVTTFMDVNVTKLVAYREENKEKFLQENAVKLTYTHLIMKAVIDAIKVYPTLNSWFNNEELLEKKNINLGFAAALPDGNLIVPNIKNAQNLSVVDIAQQVSEIGTRAKNGKLKPDDIQDTTFTVSNTGMFGSECGTPIISRPQVAVLALGNILRRAWIIEENEEEKILPQSVMTLSLSYDHRIVDGALASKFLTEIKKNMENF
ncbi:dihydrolipoamide acetyltransferase family protein [Cloacibacterium normanense]|uniref:Dihydrolipoamide acetyltransferase component of pyruvate dehydrogenase complex n=1 Tax=Cloacibacterium normanense TaxID=237258 RepID=A0A1E5UDQ3_9FLAO|nr:dihydrolipoamide acetyltransferase family protein [Cloacibacterium normanense]AZI69293.1 2-oxo acid dehydrogenase subunit E2 [Cloacibacterium normanense]OEL11012.1 e3 binding domain protein [Cloacibacterium normanense]SDO66026.1 2-oxoglutarate dehydrogenase E2 component (dihydrolipoamide succinyltransferase) [Cloacibacterium normanense]